MSVRRVGRAALVVLLAAVIGYGALALSVGLARFPAMKLDAAPDGPLQGVWHVHAEKSHDGYGTVEEAAKAAVRQGARFLMLSEHNVLRPEFPAVIDGVLIVPAVELSTPHGHVVALGLDRKVGRGKEVLANIAAAGGDAVLAHPTNLRRPWTDPSPDGFAGWEAWSLESEWRRRLASPGLPLVLAGAALAGDTRKVGALLLGDPGDDLARFDALAARRPLSLLCSVDAHGLPPYASSFGALAIHVDLGPARSRFGADPVADAAAIREAIVAGRLFCSVPALGDASSFSFRREGGEVTATVAAPGAELRLLRDGQELARGAGPTLRAPAVAPGSYRAEVRVSPGFPWPDGSTWILASPLVVSPGNEGR